MHVTATMQRTVDTELADLHGALDGLADVIHTDHVEVLGQLAQLRMEIVRLHVAMRPWYRRLWDWLTYASAH